MQIKTKSKKREFFVILLLAILLLILEIFAYVPDLSSPIEILELSVRDLKFRARGISQPMDDIVVVAIDDESMNWLGERWPWPRTRIAEIVDWLNYAGAKVIGLDITLFDPTRDPTEDQALIEALERSNAAVSVSQVVSGSYDQLMIVEPTQDYQAVLDGFGVTEVHRDDDSVVRGIVAYRSTPRGITYNWAFEVANLYLEVEGPSNPRMNSLEFNGETVPLVAGNVLLVNYAGPAYTYNNPTSYNQRPYSAAFVPLGDYPVEIFKDKIVLIGATSETLQDLYPTPYARVTLTPGVEVVANAVATILTQQYIYLAPPWFTLLLIFSMYLCSLAVIRLKKNVIKIPVFLAVIVVYTLINYVVFAKSGWHFAIVSPMLIFFLGVVIPMINDAVQQELEKLRVRNLFSRFISPGMVDQLLETKDINSLNKRATLTVLFSDIRGFTTLSEKLSPDEVVRLLNPYLAAMTAIIHKNGGTVDKYEGDAIVAFFGEPIPYEDHALRAVITSLEMRKELKLLTERWEKEGIYEGDFEIGIGINTGEVFVGLIGSEERINYTIIGDTANLAARIQDLTKEYHWPILISRSTYDAVKNQIRAEFCDERLVKGKQEPVQLFLVLEDGQESPGNLRPIKPVSNNPSRFSSLT
ncbi:MAG: adenylate/guanylate cyclase domain-containing protein [Anaerolineales bacterium]|nr:adenylate/guanylate cyclase domain-containing protein [Anaerolineales bacterium]